VSARAPGTARGSSPPTPTWRARPGLVLTGVSREADLARFAYRPDHVVADAFALRALLERGV